MTELERIFEQLKNSPNDWSINKHHGKCHISMNAVDFVLLYKFPTTDIMQKNRPYIKLYKTDGAAGYMDYYTDDVSVTALFDNGFLERNKDYIDDL